METNEDQGAVRRERRGQVEVLTLSYPARRNAVSMRMRAELLEALTAILADDGCRAVVLTGDGAHFCSGGDITSFAGVTPAAGRQRMFRIHQILRLLIAGPKPVVAAVEGAAFGAGCSIAAACDVVVAAEDAKFSCPFNRFALAPDWGGGWTLPNRMGVGRAKLFMLTGRAFGAPEAERLGLVDQLAPCGQALNTALAIAEDITRGAPLSNEVVKALLARGHGALEEALAAEADVQGVLYGTEDYNEGYAAFLEKRPPQFTGR
ncbi:MAG: enoyl-CoA hydratase/isomerase family protein [Caulobacteraceae bacterium]|nr:enoyl-CoA hydratase/isomerase family protein [Caulobacteraceae bacterium]